MKSSSFGKKVILSLFNLLAVIIVGAALLYFTLAFPFTIFDSEFSWEPWSFLAMILVSIACGIAVIYFSALSQRQKSLKQAIKALCISFIPWVLFWIAGLLLSILT